MEMIAETSEKAQSKLHPLAGAMIFRERELVVSGSFLRVASVRDEELVQGGVVPHAAEFVRDLRLRRPLRADLFSFSQNIDEPEPFYDFPFEWDNAAVTPTNSFTDWWEKRLPQETRKNVRRAAKRGVEVRTIAYDDEVVRGLKAIYDESPVRQGARFPHYGKDLETVRRENGTYHERCEYIGAFFEGQLIGFMRFVYVDHVARIMQILASLAHTDKRPMNAMIAKAVEACEARGVSWLVYSKFTFGNKRLSPLAEFKRRNGFEEVRFPRYFVPLTAKGELAVKLKWHRGLLGLLPAGVIDLLLRARALVLQRGAGA